MPSKNELFIWMLFYLGTSSASRVKEAPSQPHIILIVADDLGWYDVSWNNPRALTPNLEKLARGGVLLNQSYVQPICTPTRSALMTGRYPYTLGRQHSVLWPEEPTGLTIKRQLLPQALKQVGYSTHAVGKWHLGFCSWDYTPTSRGFDTFWGYYTGGEDYYRHVRPKWIPQSIINEPYYREEDNNETAIPFGYDFRNNTRPEYSVEGEYSTYLFSSYIENLLNTRNESEPMFLYLPFQSVHAPLQVPKNYTKPFRDIRNRNRRTKLGMVLAMDEAIGRVVQALKSTGHYNNSVIVFTTDNGGPTISAGINWPLRGNKTTLWEGGTRGVAFVHSPLLPNKGSVSNKLIHVTDWFATFVGLAGGATPKDTDGYDQWEAITTSALSPRKEMIYSIDLKGQESAGIRLGDFKLLVGNPGPGEWTPPPERKSKIHESIKPVESNIQGSHKDMTDSGVAFVEILQEIVFDKRQNKTDMLLDISDNSSDYTEDFHARLQEEVTFNRRQNEIGGFIESRTSAPADKPSKDTSTNSRNDENLVTVGDLNLNLNLYPSLMPILSNDTELRLYNLTGDPEERHNIAVKKTDVVHLLLGVLQYSMKDYVDPDVVPNDPAANPKHWNNTWTPGWCRAK